MFLLGIIKDRASKRQDAERCLELIENSHSSTFESARLACQQATAAGVDPRWIAWVLKKATLHHDLRAAECSYDLKQIESVCDRADDAGLFRERSNRLRKSIVARRAEQRLISAEDSGCPAQMLQACAMAADASVDPQWVAWVRRKAGLLDAFNSFQKQNWKKHFAAKDDTFFTKVFSACDEANASKLYSERDSYWRLQAVDHFAKALLDALQSQDFSRMAKVDTKAQSNGIPTAALELARSMQNEDVSKGLQVCKDAQDLGFSSLTVYVKAKAHSALLVAIQSKSTHRIVEAYEEAESKGIPTTALIRAKVQMEDHFERELVRTMESENVTLSEAIQVCIDAERAGLSSLTVFVRAKAHVALLEAIQSKNIHRIVESYEEAESKGIPTTALIRAKVQMEDHFERELVRTMESENVTLSEAFQVCNDAERVGFFCWPVYVKAKAHAALLDAMQSNDVHRIANCYTGAESKDVPITALARAKLRVTHHFERALAVTVDNEDVSKVFQVCKDAERVGFTCLPVFAKAKAHGALLDAMLSKDVSRIAKAFKQAESSGLRTTRKQAHLFLESIENNRDLSLVQIVCQQAKAAGVDQRWVSWVLTKAELYHELRAAECSDDLQQISSTCAKLDEAGLFSESSGALKQYVVGQRSLISAEEAADSSRMLKACKVAQAAYVDTRWVAWVQKKATLLDAFKSFQQQNWRSHFGAKDDTFFLKVARTCDEAASAELYSQRVAYWREQAKNHFEGALLRSLENEDAAKAALTCKNTELAGFDKLSAFEKTKAWLANVVLLEAMQSGNVDRIVKASKEAESKGIASATLAAARAKVALLRRVESSESVELQQRLESNLLVGRTEVHNRLATLISQVFAQHGASAAIPDLADRLKLFVPKFSRAYSLKCSKEYGLRGGMKYFKPAGWLRFAVEVKDFQKYKGWCVAYHGTQSHNTIHILLRGLQRPGDCGVTVAHGQARSSTRRTIYLSPSIEYSAHPVYAQLFELEPDRWAQVVLQCRVRPGSFKVENGSLGNKHWDKQVSFDPNFRSLAGLEWLLEDASDVIVYGFMIREFGPKADASIYGEISRQVTKGTRGPEFEWTRLRAEQFRREGLLMMSA